MAKTIYNLADAEAKKLWDEKLFRDTVKQTFFSKFMGDGANKIVQVSTDLEKDKGDTVNFGIRMRLDNTPIINGTLEGNEQALTTYMDSVAINHYRLGVRTAGKLTEQRAFFSIDSESREALKNAGIELVDQLCFDALQASPTKIIYGGAASSTATIASTDTLDAAVISKLRALAVSGLATAAVGGARNQTPIRPIMIDGKKYFVLLVHPYALYDLKFDPVFQQARREAEVRGSENPIFSGATAIWDGVVIHEHENIPLVSTWGAGSNVVGAKNIFMGEQALYWAWAKRPEVIVEKFDYENETGYGWGMIAGVTKPSFNSKDYGSIAVYTAATDVGA